jgi:F-box/leucine-rich repeat protein 2/20
MGQCFAKLRHLKLTGCFLCKDDAFQVMFEKLGHQLETLELADIPKITVTSFGMLKGEALTCLKVKRCEKLGDEFLSHVGTYQSLNTFKFMNTHRHVTKQALQEVVERIGSKLKVLTLSGFESMEDDVLQSLVICQNLEELSLSHCEMITEDGMKQFLNQMSTLRLTKLNWNRLIQLKDESLSLAIKLYGFYLKRLNLNGLDELSENSLKLLATRCPSLEHLDCSWVRGITDELLETLFSHAKQLQKVKVYGLSSVNRMCFKFCAVQ